MLIIVIGVSLSEPSPTLASWTVDFSYLYIYIYIYLPYIHRSVNANWHSFNPKNCTRRSVQVKYPKQLCKGFSYTDWPSEAPKSAQEQEDRWWRRKRQIPACCRDSRPKERKVEKLRVRDCARRAHWLKLLVKDKPLYSRKVRERREAKLSRREEWG